MGVKISNYPTRTPKTLQPHHIRHMISGTLVFLMGVGVNEGLLHLRRHWPKTVRWSANEIQSDYTLPNGLPPTNVQVDLGITDDGYYVWRVRKQAQDTGDTGSQR